MKKFVLVLVGCLAFTSLVAQDMTIESSKFDPVEVVSTAENPDVMTYEISDLRAEVASVDFQSELSIYVVSGPVEVSGIVTPYIMGVNPWTTPEDLPNDIIYDDTGTIPYPDLIINDPEDLQTKNKGPNIKRTPN